jgi:hypothetical protein
MISIRRYLDLYRRPRSAPDDPVAPAGLISPDFQASLAQLATVLVSEIGAEADGGPEDIIGPFSASMRDIQQRLETAESPEDLEALSAELPSVLRELRDAKRKIEQEHTEEVQKMVAMLQQTIEALSRGNGRSVSRLRRIETQIRSASQISEIVALRERLRACIDEIRDEAAAEQREFAKSKSQLERDFLVVQESAALARGGIPGRSQAERRIADASATGSLMLVLLERLPAIKARYGAGVSERYFSGFLSQLSGRLPSPKKIFRWNEQAVLVELPCVAPDSGEAELRSQLGDISRAVQMDVGGRVAVLENTHRWFLAAGGAGRDDTFRKIEDFLGA